MNTFLEAALYYVDLGYRVFPCRPGTKVPLTKNGFLDASIEPEQVELWWKRYPDANIAIPTDSLLVLDDDGSGWLDPERQLDLVGNPMSITPRGGKHWVFRQPDGRQWRSTVGKLANKLDIRACGGYFLVPPSRDDKGTTYRWINELNVSPQSLDKPPDWLTEVMDQLEEPGTTVLVTGNTIPVGHRNDTLARLAGTMRRVGMSQSEIMAALLTANQERCYPPLRPSEVEAIAASVSRYEPDSVAVALTENHWEQMIRPREPEPEDPGPLPESLLYVPGFVQEVMEYTLSTAPYPEPMLAFCGALSLQATLAGRKVRDELDNRTGIYLLGLANSGVGKDYPRKVNERILSHVGLSACLGDSFASGEGIEDRLLLNPAMLFQTDEIDGLMAKIRSGKDARFESIMNVLLKVYTSANSIYPLRVRAGKDPAVIDQPSLCLFGTAVPSNYYQALSKKMLTNGFFARMLVMECGKRGVGQEAPYRPIPDSILGIADWWAKEAAGNLDDLHPDPKLVTQTPEAAEALRAMRLHADAMYTVAEERDDQASMTVWARAHEKTRRLALIYACSECYENPIVNDRAATWARDFVDHQTRRMLFMSEGNVSESEFDAMCKALVNTLKKWRDKHGDDWMPAWQIHRRHPWSQRDHDEVRTILVHQKLIEFEERKTGGPPQRLYRLR